MGVLTPIDAAAHYPFGILNRNASLAPFHVDDETHHHHHQDQDQQGDENAHLTSTQQAHGADDAVWHAGDNSGKNDQGDAIADPVFRNLFAEPHDEGGSGGEGDDGDQPKSPAALENHHFSTRGGHPFHANGNTEALDDTQDDRAVAGVLGNLFSSCLAFLAQLLQMRDDDGQQLQDDRSADVGHDAKGKDR